MKRLIVLLICLFYFKINHATDLAGQAITMVIRPNTLMSINGNLFIGSNLTFQNQGNLYVQHNIQIDSLGLIQGSGHYFLNGNWTNNGQFLADSSILKLNGAIHFLQGKNSTTFYDVFMAPSSYVYQSTAIAIVDTLNLGNAIWNVGSDTLQLLNTDSAHLKVIMSFAGNATSNSSGYFAGNPKGCVLREVNTGQNYFYPFGDSLFSGFYKSVMIASSDTSVKMVGGMLIHQNYLQYKWSNSLPDSTVCAIDTNWYFLLTKKNPLSVKVPSAVFTPYYLSCTLEDNLQTDGFFNAMANFEFVNSSSSSNSNSNSNSSSNSSSNSMGTWQILPSPKILSSSHLAINSMYISATISSALFQPLTSSYSNLPIILAKIRPIMPSLSGDLAPCIHTTSNYSILLPNHFGLDAWLDSQLLPYTIMGDSIRYTILWKGKLNPTLHFILKDSSDQCYSSTKNYSISVHPGPHASFSYQVIQRNPIQTIQFQDSSSNATHWFWDFGNNTTANTKDPFVGYSDPGYYWIKDLVTDQFGCNDSMSTEISIAPNLFIPNVFTPNADGVNDEFIINGLGATLQSLQIFNRWGSEVYNGSTAPLLWNGLNFNGEPCPEGTYYYIAEIKWGYDAITFSANNKNNINQGGPTQTQATPQTATQVYKGNITLLR